MGRDQHFLLVLRSWVIDLLLRAVSNEKDYPKIKDWRMWWFFNSFNTFKIHCFMNSIMDFYFQSKWLFSTTSNSKNTPKTTKPIGKLRPTMSIWNQKKYRSSSITYSTVTKFYLIEFTRWSTKTGRPSGWSLRKISKKFTEHCIKVSRLNSSITYLLMIYSKSNFNFRNSICKWWTFHFSFLWEEKIHYSIHTDSKK